MTAGMLFSYESISIFLHPKNGRDNTSPSKQFDKHEEIT